MFDLVVPPAGAKGADLLLLHCAALTRPDDVRPAAFERLEGAVGADLARLLVGALARPARELAA